MIQVLYHKGFEEQRWKLMFQWLTYQSGSKTIFFNDEATEAYSQS